MFPSQSLLSLTLSANLHNGGGTPRPVEKQDRDLGRRIPIGTDHDPAHGRWATRPDAIPPRFEE
jgi:hypothetical protein